MVYHWTSKENAIQILKIGLRQWSFICRNSVDWRGEVCLKISLPYEIDWDSRDKYYTWQGVVSEKINSSKIKILYYK